MVALVNERVLALGAGGLRWSRRLGISIDNAYCPSLRSIIIIIIIIISFLNHSNRLSNTFTRYLSIINQQWRPYRPS